MKANKRAADHQHGQTERAPAPSDRDAAAPRLYPELQADAASFRALGDRVFELTLPHTAARPDDPYATLLMLIAEALTTTAAIIGRGDPHQRIRDLADLAETGEAIASYATSATPPRSPPPSPASSACCPSPGASPPSAPPAAGHRSRRGPARAVL